MASESNLKIEFSGSRVPKRALITGQSGQDGSYLSELLLAKGYEVYGPIEHGPIDTCPAATQANP